MVNTGKHIGMAFLLAMLSISFESRAQEDFNEFPYHGIIRASASFGTGFMPKSDLQNVYMHGDLEYYLNKRISVRSEAFYFFNVLNNDNPPLLMNHQLFSGALYHFRPDKPLDLYVGFQPGIAYSQSSDVPCNTCITRDATEVPSNKTFNPLVSGMAGVNYYATKIFHFFISARYLTGTHLSNKTPLSLNEFRVSFGLGLNFRTKQME